MILSKIPLPPSINGLYLSSKGRLIKSREGRIFDQKIEIYKLKNFRILQEMHDIFKNHVLRIDRYFVFNKNRVYTKKDNSVKKLDPTNFIKSFDDGLARLLMIDDKFFKSGLCEMVFCLSDSEEQVIVKIEKHEMKSLEMLIGSI